MTFTDRVLKAPRETCRRAGGFTLIELLVTVVVLSILLGLAVPAFRSFMQNDQQWTQQNDLILALNTARSEAIKDDLPGGVSVCASTGTGNPPTCDGTSWAQGWIVQPSADPFNPNSGLPGKPLQTVGALPAGTTLTEVNAKLSVTFLSNGAVNTPVAFTMCDIRGAAYARYLQVTPMGRVAASPTVGKDLSSPPATLACP
jgi:type IV fimbrial biogenesis protein FimT